MSVGPAKQVGGCVKLQRTKIFTATSMNSAFKMSWRLCTVRVNNPSFYLAISIPSCCKGADRVDFDTSCAIQRLGGQIGFLTDRFTDERFGGFGKVADDVFL